MKKSVLIIVLIGILFLVVNDLKRRYYGEYTQNKIMISGAWALYPMTIKWAEEFQRIHPGVKIDISAGGAGKGMADSLGDIVDIGMVSRKIYPEEVNKGAWGVPVAKDAVVATINAENPILKKIQERGLKRADLIAIWITKTLSKWGDIAACEGNHCPDEETFFINSYTRSDACGAADTWARFLGVKQEDLQGIGVYGDPGLTDAVKRDVLAIGFNNINYAYDAYTHQPIEGIAIVPLDLDDDGNISPEESFYGSVESIDQAILDGRYPSPPARDLYFVSHGVPKKKIVRDFIRWVVTDGQAHVRASGYIPISQDKIDEALKQLGAENSDQP